VTDDPGSHDAVRVLLDDEIHVHYRFLDLLPHGADATPGGSAYAGQHNGLCGARRAGALSMQTGTHTGAVPVRVEAHREAPPVPDDWQDVVEVPFTPAGSRYALSGFDQSLPLELPPGIGRARWCADRMDDGYDGARTAGAPVTDRYLLQLWPAAPEPDAVVRTGSRRAERLHRSAQEAQPFDIPPAVERVEPPPGDGLRILREHMARELDPTHPTPRAVRRAGAPAVVGAGSTSRPDAPPPTRADMRASLRRMQARLGWLADTYPELTARLAAAPASEQRAVAGWAARRLVVAAGLAADGQLAAVLDAVRDGRPAPLVRAEDVTDRLLAGAPGSIARPGSPVPEPDAPAHPTAAAVDAVLRSVSRRPADAVTGAVQALVRQAEDRPGAIADVLARLDAAAGGVVPEEEYAEPTEDDRRRLRQTEQERADVARTARQAALDRLRWGPVTPSERLRAIPGNTSWLARAHHDLAERIAHAPAAAQRELAVRGARRALAAAGLEGDAELAAALDAASAARPHPPLDPPALWQRLLPGPRRAEIRMGTPPPTVRLHPTALAVDAVLQAVQADTAAAAIGVVAVMLHSGDDPEGTVATASALLDDAGA
jgi:hypothetical protein